ncbi:MAG: MBL fold metallo-hydrolase [Chloroflexi bacterium]|nr:MBL fold metallo-hydrolase [Chloroflexota bacterium]
MRLTDRLYLAGSGSLGFDLTDEYDCNIYLLDGGSEAALIDAGGGRDVPSIMRIIEENGVPLERVRYLFLTHAHADHAGGAAAFREELGLQVLAAHDVVDFLQENDERIIALELAKEAGIYPPDFCFRACPVDRELREGQKVVVGDCELLVMETPGHAAGCLSFLMERAGKQYLFGGDTILFEGRIVLRNVPDCDLQAYIRTIERLSSLSVDVFLPGHLCFSLRNGQRHIDAAKEVLKTLGVPPNLM